MQLFIELEFHFNALWYCIYMYVTELQGDETANFSFAYQYDFNHFNLINLTHIMILVYSIKHLSLCRREIKSSYVCHSDHSICVSLCVFECINLQLDPKSNNVATSRPKTSNFLKSRNKTNFQE